MLAPRLSSLTLIRRLPGCRKDQKMRSAIRIAAATLLAAISVSAATGTDPFPRRNPVVEAILKTRESVVGIRVVRNGARETVGTGVIIDERGLVVTCRHVVGNRDAVQVALRDGSEYEANVVGVEIGKDLAVLQILNVKRVAFLPLAPVSDLMIGEDVIAVGHPYGYTNTVSKGIIGALNRSITMPTGDVLTGLIQTDASINPGNSGGPLLNINGELIGINVALREGAQGIAFAINAGTVKEVLRKHLSAQRIAGVQHGLDFQEKVVGEIGDRQQVIVAGLHGTSNGLQAGDVIKSVAERPVSNSFDFERALWDKRAGQRVELLVERGGQTATALLTLLPQSGAGTLAEANNQSVAPNAQYVPNRGVSAGN